MVEHVYKYISIYDLNRSFLKKVTLKIFTISIIFIECLHNSKSFFFHFEYLYSNIKSDLHINTYVNDVYYV